MRHLPAQLQTSAATPAPAKRASTPGRHVKRTLNHVVGPEFLYIHTYIMENKRNCRCYSHPHIKHDVQKPFCKPYQTHIHTKSTFLYCLCALQKGLWGLRVTLVKASPGISYLRFLTWNITPFILFFNTFLLIFDKLILIYDKI